MSTLHERLLARITELSQHLTGCVSCSTCEAAALGHAVRDVAELHAPRPCRCRDNFRHEICGGCPGHLPPRLCPTVKAIARALGVESE